MEMGGKNKEKKKREGNEKEENKALRNMWDVGFGIRI